MSRGFWFLAGAGAGVYAMIRGRRVAEAFTVEGMTDRVGALALGVRMFRDEVVQGMADAEPAIRERIAGLETPPRSSAALDQRAEAALEPREDHSTNAPAEKEEGTT